MSIVTSTVDFNPMLAWKMPPKKCIELKNVGLIPVESTTHQIQILQNCTIQAPISITRGTECHITEQQHHSIQQHEQEHHLQHLKQEQEHHLQHLKQEHHLQQHHEPQHQILHQQHQIQYQQHIQQQSIQQQIHIETEQQQQNQCNTEPQLNPVTISTTINIASKKPKEKVTSKKKFKRFPVDGMAYHSQLLGLKVPPKKTLGIKGMLIHSQAREVINNVFKFMKEEAHNGIKIPISNYRERVLAATGISKCTYSKITTKEFRLGEPQPSRKRKTNFLEVKCDETFVEQASENDNSYRPKINRDASTRDGVYNLEDLVPGNILDMLAPEAGKIMSEGTVEPYLSPFPAASISKILSSGAHEEIQVRSITIFLYIHYLIKYMTTPMKSVTKKFVVCDKSDDVNTHILDNFSVNSQHGRTRPLHIKDKALCFILVLAAIALDYEVDVQSLSKDLKIGVKKTLEVSRILAFNASSKDKHVVQLKLPLPDPVSFNPKRKRKTL